MKSTCGSLMKVLPLLMSSVTASMMPRMLSLLRILLGDSICGHRGLALAVDYISFTSGVDIVKWAGKLLELVAVIVMALLAIAYCYWLER
jgi:hypothetical protein